MKLILPIGAVVIVAVLLIYEEIEKHNANAASSSAAQNEADASVYGIEGQGNEITNIPSGGSTPANSPGTTEVPLTYGQEASAASQNVGGGLTTAELNAEAAYAKATVSAIPGYGQNISAPIDDDPIPNPT